MKKILVVLSALILLIAGCTQQNQNELERFDQSTFEAGFDTVVRLIAYTSDSDEFDQYFEQMTNEFYYLHKLYDKYNEYDGINNIKTINENAGIAPVEVDPFIIDLLNVSKFWYDNGYQLLDVSFGSVLKVWHNYREQGLDANNDGIGGKVPTFNKLNNAKECTGWDIIEIDEVNSTVYLNQACASLDVGAIAKGYATEVVANNLEEAGLKYALISAGGNVRSINTREDGSAWGVGVELPEMFSQRSADTLRIPTSTSIVTSGDYQRYYEGEDGLIYHHLINPNTLFPESFFHSVTIVADDSAIADALSTILFLMDYEQGLSYITELQNTYPNELIGAFWIFHKNQNIPTVGNILESEGYNVGISDSLLSYSRVFNE